MEVVGHQNETIVDAIQAAAVGGFVFGFGEVVDPAYVIPCRQIYEKVRPMPRAGLRAVGPGSSRTAATHLAKHKKDFGSYVSHVVPVARCAKGLIRCTPVPRPAD